MLFFLTVFLLTLNGFIPHMDKRNITFIISVLLSFLVIQFGFQYFEQENLRDSREKQKLAESKKQKELRAEITDRQADASQLPLVEIYTNESQDTSITGVWLDGSIAVLPWTSSLPDTMFIKSGSTMQPLKLTGQSSSPVVLYSPDEPKKIKTPALQTVGSFDLQLLTPDENVFLAYYRDGHFLLAGKELKLEGDEVNQWIPNTNAFAFFKTQDGYKLTGIYQADKKKFITLERIAALNGLVEKERPAIAESSKETEESFYLLENDFFQLVFSNKGGALSEVNLAFKSDLNPDVIVKPIEYDREMLVDAPQNAHFPSHPYYTAPKKPNGSPIAHQEGTLGGYYPLLRRDLIGATPDKSFKISPEFYALNTVSDFPEVAELIYEVTHFDETSITFEANQPHRKIVKTYRIFPGQEGAPYIIEAEFNIEGDSRGLWITSGIPEVELISGSPAPALKYRLTRGTSSEVENMSLPSDSIVKTSIYPDWLCNSNGFFGLVVDPLSAVEPGFKALMVSPQKAPSRLFLVETAQKTLKPAEYQGYEMLYPLKASGGKLKMRLYAGPFAGSVLKTVDAFYKDPTTGETPDYVACQSFHGWFKFISEPFSKLLFFLMQLFHNLTGSWGISIILLTIAVRIMLYPLNAWSMKSMIKNQEISPKINAIREKYKNDPQKMNLKIMELYKESGVNPLGGCFPILIQMPFMIGMFDLLKSAFELRGASFIPGWIDNLTAPDVLFSWSTPIPFIGTQFHLLPILLGGVMFVQQRLMSNAPSDVNEMTPEQRQSRMMGSTMTVMFTFLFYHFPSGLNIYWLFSMMLGILQQWFTMKNMKKVAQPEAAIEVEGKKLPKRKKSRM